jgi:tetratricopeptide (TPR) repeat protein
LALYKNYYILFFIVIVSARVYSQSYPDKEINSELNKGIALIINQNYNQAEEEFSVLIKKNPSFPLWNLYLAAAKIAKAYDYGEDYEDDAIKKNLEKSLYKSEKLLEKDERNIWYIYFEALSKGYLAYYNALDENWFGSMKYGMSAINGFEKCTKINPAFYDAYVGLGSFKYWKSRKTEFMKWLPFFSDEKEAGISYLIKAKDHNSYNSHLAIYNLTWIYIDEKKYGDAIKISEFALKMYPDTRLFKWGLARAYEAVDINKSILLYSEILNSLYKDGVKNHYKEIILKYTLARNYAKIGDKLKAIKQCDEILQINNNIDSKARKRLEDRISKVKELKNKLIN